MKNEEVIENKTRDIWGKSWKSEEFLNCEETEVVLGKDCSSTGFDHEANDDADIRDSTTQEMSQGKSFYWIKYVCALMTRFLIWMHVVWIASVSCR